MKRTPTEFQSDKSFISNIFQVLIMDPYVSLRESKSLICFYAMLTMFEDRERSSAIVTPLYFAAETPSSSTLCKIYLVSKGFTF